MSLTRAILCFLTGVFLAQLVYYYPNLPETVASHYDGFGAPDAWMKRGNFLAFEVVILAVIILEFAFLPLFLRNCPKYPHRSQRCCSAVFSEPET